MTTIAPHLPDQIEHLPTATLESTGQTFDQVKAQRLSNA